MAEWRLWTQSDRDRVTGNVNAGTMAVADELSRLPLTTFDRVSGGKLPRNHNARSYRLTVGSSVVAVVTVCYRRMKNCLELSTAILSDAVAADDDDAIKCVIRELLQFVLTDAYRCSGLCALTFGRFNSRLEQITLERIESYVRHWGIDLSSPLQHGLTVDQGRQLYLSLSGLSDAASEVVSRLDALGRVRSESVCFLTASGVWTVSQCEGLLVACSVPDVVFAGGAGPADRHMHHYALDHARMAVLAGRLQDFLESQWQETDGVVRPVTHQTRQVSTQVSIGSGMRLFKFTANDSLSLKHWTRSTRESFSFGQLRVSIIARSRGELEAGWESMVPAAALTLCPERSYEGLAIALPADFDQMRADVRRQWLDFADEHDIILLVAPDTYAQISAEALRKLSFSRTIRR